MRIVSRKYKGRKIITANKLPVRPTTGRAKEALFNILESRYYFDNKNMLDLFAGTGNISYEFATRGVKKITAIDNNYNCTNYIKEKSTKLGFKITAIKSDSLQYLKNCKQKFNFIFADPPYNYENYQELKNLIFKKNIVKKDGCIIIEHDRRISFSDNNIELRKYGKVHFSIFSL